MLLEWLFFLVLDSLIDWFDLPNLTTFTTGRRAFSNTTCLSLNSMMFDNWLIWSSSTHYIQDRVCFIFLYRQFEFIKCDDIWLVYLIFLISPQSQSETIHLRKPQYCVYQVGWLLIDWLDLPNLTTFTTGYNSFHKVKRLFLSGLMIGDWLIWSSYALCSIPRLWFFQRDKCCFSVKCFSYLLFIRYSFYEWFLFSWFKLQ